MTSGGIFEGTFFLSSGLTSGATSVITSGATSVITSGRTPGFAGSWLFPFPLLISTFLPGRSRRLSRCIDTEQAEVQNNRSDLPANQAGHDRTCAYSTVTMVV